MGQIVGLVSASEAIEMGPVHIEAGPEALSFRAEFDVSDLTDDERKTRMSRISLAIQAGIAAASGVAVRVQVSNASYCMVDGRRQQTAQVTLASVNARARLADMQAGAEAVRAVFDGGDLRLADLYEVYLLGAQARQTIAPVVGFWAFSNILEEESGGANNLKRVPEMVASMRRNRYDIPPNPPRELDTIRAAAVHPSPNLPAPTRDEIEWFRRVALACLRRRGARSRADRP